MSLGFENLPPVEASTTPTTQLRALGTETSDQIEAALNIHTASKIFEPQVSMAATKRGKLSKWSRSNASTRQQKGYAEADDGNWFPISSPAHARIKRDRYVFTGRKCANGHKAIRRMLPGLNGSNCTACDSRASMNADAKVRKMIFEPIRRNRAKVSPELQAFSRGLDLDSGEAVECNRWLERMRPHYELLLALRNWEKDGLFAFPDDELTTDHVIPLTVRGTGVGVTEHGSHSPENLQILTQGDNSRKWSKLTALQVMRLKDWQSPWSLEEARMVFQRIRPYVGANQLDIRDAAEEYALFLRDAGRGVPPGPIWIHPSRRD